MSRKVPPMTEISKKKNTNFGLGDDHDHAKSTDYALDEPNKDSNILSINDPIFEEISRQGKPRRLSQKKNTPRVIGAGKEKKKTKDKVELKGPRFAKRSSSPTAQKTPTNQVSLFDFSSSISKKDDDNKSLFDFSAAAEPKGDEQESVFDFGSADAPPPQPVGAGNNEEASVFSFTDAEPSNNQQGLSFSAANDTPFFLADSTQAAIEENNNGKELDDNESASLSNKSEEGIFSENEGEISPTIIDQFMQLHGEVKNCAKQVSLAREVMKSAKLTDIPASRVSYESKREELLSLLDKAIELTKDAPNLLKERETIAKNELPQLQKQKEDSVKQLSDLEVQQTRDRLSVDNAKKSSEASINSLNRSYDIQLKAFNIKKQQYEQNMNNTLNPITERLAEIEQEKLNQENIIAELMKKIEEHKEKIAKLDIEYEEKMKVYEDTEAKFNSAHELIAEEERQLQEHRTQTDSKIRQIEAPYQSLIDNVEKRERQMKAIIKKTQRLDSMIEDCKRDTNQSSSAAMIVNKLFNSHSETVKKRISTKARIEAATSKLQQLSQVSQPKDEEVQMLKIKSTRAAEIIKQDTERIAQLEAEKKASIAQKNFMAAKQITLQIKELQDQLTNAQNTVVDSEKQIAQIESENSHQHAQIREVREELEDARYTFLENDFNYFESMIAVLDGLFELSPYGAKLLKPLQSLLLSGLNDIERPPKLDPNLIKTKIAELSKRLDIVVAEEDYEAADAIQEQINKLNSKLAHA